MQNNSPKVLLVTGASRGIGAACARLAAAQGWQVAVNFRSDAASAQAVVAAICAAGGQARAYQADLADNAQLTGLFAAIDADLGRLRALVNNAGIVAPTCKVQDMSAERIARMMAVNVCAPMLCAREALRRMDPALGGAGGVIVNVSSAAARLGGAGQYVDYAASKGAIDSFTVGLAREVAAQGVRVVGVRPGLIDTDIHASAGQPDRIARQGPGLPMGRAGRADEVAQAIVWLLSDAASYTSGAILDVSGAR